MPTKPKFGLRNLVSNPDDLLLGSTATPVSAPASSQVELPEKTRFTNVLPTDTFRRLHQLSFWSREDMSSILDEALKAYFIQFPDADRELPEKEKLKRKLG